MDKEIKVSKMHINMPGDPSVGIFPVCWTLEPEMFFYDEEAFETFKDDILIAFEKAFDQYVYIETQEEIDEIEREFEKAAREAFDNITENDYQEPLNSNDK